MRGHLLGKHRLHTCMAQGNEGAVRGVPLQVGGTPAVLKYLNAKGYINANCMTVTGKTMGENLAQVSSSPSRRRAGDVSQGQETTVTICMLHSTHNYVLSRDWLNATRGCQLHRAWGHLNTWHGYHHTTHAAGGSCPAVVHSSGGVPRGVSNPVCQSNVETGILNAAVSAVIADQIQYIW